MSNNDEIRVRANRIEPIARDTYNAMAATCVSPQEMMLVLCYITAQLLLNNDKSDSRDTTVDKMAQVIKDRMKEQIQ